MFTRSACVCVFVYAFVCVFVWFEGVRYQLPNTLPFLLPIGASMSCYWMQTGFVFFLCACVCVCMLFTEWMGHFWVVLMTDRPLWVRGEWSSVGSLGVFGARLGHRGSLSFSQECLIHLTTLSVLVLLCLVRSCLSARVCMRVTLLSVVLTFNLSRLDLPTLILHILASTACCILPCVSWLSRLHHIIWLRHIDGY